MKLQSLWLGSKSEHKIALLQHWRVRSQTVLGLQGSSLKNAGLQDENFRGQGLHIICFRSPTFTKVYKIILICKNSVFNAKSNT